MKIAIFLLVIVGLGWAHPPPPPQPETKSLKTDLEEVLGLISWAKVKAVLDDHLEKDPVFVHCVIYLQGDRWAELVDTVLHLPRILEFIDYLNERDIPVQEIIDFIHDLIHSAVPGIEPEDEGSLIPFLEDLLEVIPVLDVAGAVLDKLQNSSDFQDLYREISSPEAREVVEYILALPEAMYIQSELTRFGVPVKEILAAIFAFLGWN